MKNSRLDYLDIAKGISLFFVILSHSKMGIPFAASIFTSSYIAVFFIISGYLSNPSNFNIKKRFKRLIYPYLFYSFLLLLLMIIINIINNDFNIKSVFSSIIGIVYSRNFLFYPYNIDNNLKFLNICNGPLWFFTAMFSASIIYFIFKKIYKKNNWYKIALIISFLLITYLFSYLPILLPWSIDTAFLFALFLYVGTYLKDNNIIEKYFNYNFLKKIIVFIFIFALYLIFVKYNNGINLSIREFGYHGFSSIILIFIIGIFGSFLFILFGKIISKIRLLKFLFINIGKNSVILFSLHYFIFYLIEQFITIDNIFLISLIEVFVAIFILIVIKLLLNFYLDKMNIIRYKKYN